MKWIRVTAWVIITHVLCLLSLLDCCLAQVITAAKGHPRQEPASVDISLLQNELNFLVEHIHLGVDALTIDWEEIDSVIVDWFNGKKLSPGPKWEPIRNLSKEKFNELVEKSKAAARAHVGLMINSWNDAVREGGATVTAKIEDLWRMGPYGKVTGVYRYQQGFEDPADPGWELGELVVIYQFMPFALSVSHGLEEVEIKAAADLDALVAGASAEVITKLHSQFTIEAYVKLPHLLEPPQEPKVVVPFPPNPPNRPIAETGFQASIAAGFKSSADVSALLKLGSWLNVGPVVIDLGPVKGRIEKGEFRKVAADQ